MKFISLTITVILTFLTFQTFAEESRSIKFSATLEEEFGYVSAEDNKISDFALATAELGSDIFISPNIVGKMVFIYEQGKNDDMIVIDEGTISINTPIKMPSLSFSLGYLTLPFGEFNSHFVSDPYSLEINETKRVALLASANLHEALDLSLVVYNGKIKAIEDSDHINDFVSRLAFNLPENENLSLTFGGSFISNMAEVDGLIETIQTDILLEKSIGLGSFASIEAFGGFLEFEFTTALKNIKLKNSGELKPQTFNIELGYYIPNTPVMLAGKFEKFSEKDGESISRFGGLISYEIFKDNSSFSLEFLRTDSDGSTENSITGQLAISF